MKKWLSWLILLSLVYLSCMGDKVFLQLNVQPGDVFKSRSIVSQHIEQTIENNNWAMDQIIIIDYGYQILEKDDQGNIKIQVTYDGIGFVQDSPMGHFEYKSWEGNGAEPAIAQGFASILGQSFTMTVSDQLKIVTLEGLDAMVEKMVDAIEIPEGVSREQVKENYQNQFGDESMRENMEQTFAYFPELPIRQGDTWYRKIDLKKGFPMRLETQYELTEITDEDLRLSAVSTIRPSLQPAGMQLGGVGMQYNLRGQQKGDVIIDRTSGWIKLLEFTQDFNGQVEVLDQSGKLYFRFPLKVSGNIKTELIK